MTRARLALALLAGLLAGCGGGGSSAVTPGASSANAQAATANGSVVLSIPTQTSSSAVRYPQFVSPNASSVSIAVNSGTAQMFDVSATSSLCTTSSGARNCKLTFGAPTGNDTLVLTIFSGPNGTGTTLASTTTTATVSSGTPFNVTVAMNAAIGTIVASIKSNSTNTSSTCNVPSTVGAQTAITEGCGAGGATLTVTASDPSGAQITGTAAYATPIQVSGNDPSLGASPTSITAPGQTVALSYTGAPLAQSLGNTATLSLTIGTQVVSISVPILRQNLYVANSNAPPGTSAPGGGNIVVYPFGGSTPIRTISGASTGLSNPLVPLLDASGNLYVLDNGVFTTQSHPVILVFAPGANGNVAPARQITGLSSITGNQACDNFTFDPTGQSLLVVCDDISTNGIHVLQANTNGPAVQTATLKCATTCFSHAVGIAFDPVGNLWVAETGMNDVFSFAKGTFSLSGGSQNITPQSTLNGTSGVPWPSNVSPLGLGFSASGTLYVDSIYFNSTAGAPDANNRVSAWNASTLACNCAPSVALTGAPFTTHAPGGMAADFAGNLYVGNQFNNTISVFAPSTLTASTANPPVLRTINTGSNPNAPTGMAVGP